MGAAKPVITCSSNASVPQTSPALLSIGAATEALVWHEIDAADCHRNFTLIHAYGWALREFALRGAEIRNWQTVMSEVREPAPLALVGSASGALEMRVNVTRVRFTDVRQRCELSGRQWCTPDLPNAALIALNLQEAALATVDVRDVTFDAAYSECGFGALYISLPPIRSSRTQLQDLKFHRPAGAHGESKSGSCIWTFAVERTTQFIYNYTEHAALAIDRVHVNGHGNYSTFLAGIFNIFSFSSIIELTFTSVCRRSNLNGWLQHDTCDKFDL